MLLCYRPVSTPVKLYCWHLVLVSSVGGLIALVSSISSLDSTFKESVTCWGKV